MKIMIGFLLLVASLVSCKKNNGNPILSGNYAGTATQIIDFNLFVYNIQLTFAGNSFQGKSDEALPIICSGHFQISADSIDFQNPCILPANLDESFILTGKYRVLIQGDSLYFSRTTGYSPYGQDVYTLKKQ
jgi:hypothetical protein